ncbi:LpxI family protein [Pseudohoeflea coraliihabitans]|uniref:UDP-2,3-diacylglucosamine diphosphatase LpxI n=1 Tax=Pseudohoeflea coraliihabitans TaxID=2860393 RepID=A0ABS6WRA7_9HYPH|nr:UDP-2,3-diacylglucosamine diphosphatase LpxI [Pseudohoeflea sp. DP4N28-3]MBW3098491.1 UDP-2,3-diacylglucosamine diphosphatase LpxI [Pseudohoeflea sp. DP4N28-3]
MAAKTRFAIIAGGGRLPEHVAQSVRQAGEEPFILALQDEADQDWTGFAHHYAPLADFRRIARLLRANNVARVVLSGSIQRRPEWYQARPTLRSLKWLPVAFRSIIRGGDDMALRMAISLLENEGFSVVGAHDIAPDLLADLGPLGTCKPAAADWRDIEQGRRAALHLGALDVGQGAVAVSGRVIALEGLEGTDEMLDRVAGLRAKGRLPRRAGGVLVKTCKPAQERRADLPSIGPRTVERAERAGLSGIAVEAGCSLVLDRDQLIEAADAAGLFVFGLAPGAPAEDAPTEVSE